MGCKSMFIEGIGSRQEDDGSQTAVIERHKRKTTGSPQAIGWAKSHVKGENGAGEGIRTLDPNLGKVVLYH
jgi:hypothetical protein